MRAIRFEPRYPPLAVVGVAAQGAAATALARAFAEAGQPGLAVGGGSWLVLLTEDPPWADGARFLGIDPEAPGLRLPTASRPDLPAGLLEAALRQKFPRTAWPLALLPDPLQVLALGLATPVSPAALQRWIDR